MTPSAALYWHIGATLIRLVSSRPLILYGENSALVMNDARWKEEFGKGARYRWRRDPLKSIAPPPAPTSVHAGRANRPPDILPAYAPCRRPGRPRKLSACRRPP